VKKALIAVAFILTCAVASPAAVRVSLMGGYAAALEWSAGRDFGISAAAEFDLAGFLAIGARVTRTSVPIPASSSSTKGLSQGRLTLIPVALFLQFRWPGAGKLKPYIAAGGGTSFNSHAPAAAVKEGWDLVGFTAEENVENTTAVFAGAGLDYSLSPRLIFTAHAQIVVAPLSGTWTHTDTATGLKATGNLSAGNGLNSVLAGIGMKYQF
jgi:outer membrane protein W